MENSRERDEITSVRQHSPAIDTLIIGHPSQRINNYTTPPKQTSALLATQNCSSISETESVIFSDASIKPIVSSCDDCSACRLLLGGFRRAVCMLAASRSCSHRLTANIFRFSRRFFLRSIEQSAQQLSRESISSNLLYIEYPTEK